MALPSGYTRLEYIESTGTQYISTGITPTENTKVVIEFNSSSSSGVVFGQDSGYKVNAFMFAMTVVVFDSTKKDISISANAKHTVQVAPKAFKVDNGSSQYIYANKVKAAYPMFLFGNNRNGKFSEGVAMKLYSFKVYENDVLIADYIPCRNDNTTGIYVGAIGLWDDVNNLFYPNAGTGTFIAGELPTGTHKTLINGTAYEVKSGKCLINGTGYSIKKGRTLIGGTGADIVFSSVSSVLDENDWATIREVSDAGQGANYWSIGDRKAITLNGTVGHLSLSDYTTYAFIIGLNHNSNVEGKNRIHFQLAKTALSGGTDVCFCDNKYGPDSGWSSPGAGYFVMNASNTNSGGWKSSQMRTNICGTSLSRYSGTIIAVIPAALRAVLKSVTKYTDNTANDGGSTASYVTATTDYFFLLSEFEVFGSISYGNTNEKNKQAQYAYYSAGNSKIKYKHSATSTAAFWWIRSPFASDSASFVSVRTDGTVDYYGTYCSLGFAPGFCV